MFREKVSAVLLLRSGRDEKLRRFRRWRMRTKSYCFEREERKGECQPF